MTAQKIDNTANIKKQVQSVHRSVETYTDGRGGRGEFLRGIFEDMGIFHVFQLSFDAGGISTHNR